MIENLEMIQTKMEKKTNKLFALPVSNPTSFLLALRGCNRNEWKKMSIMITKKNNPLTQLFVYLENVSSDYTNLSKVQQNPKRRYEALSHPDVCSGGGILIYSYVILIFIPHKNNTSIKAGWIRHCSPGSSLPLKCTLGSFTGRVDPTILR